jgi:hypothetical protein
MGRAPALHDCVPLGCWTWSNIERRESPTVGACDRVLGRQPQGAPHRAMERGCRDDTSEMIESNASADHTSRATDAVRQQCRPSRKCNLRAERRRRQDPKRRAAASSRSDEVLHGAEHSAMLKNVMAGASGQYRPRNERDRVLLSGATLDEEFRGLLERDLLGSLSRYASSIRTPLHLS